MPSLTAKDRISLCLFSYEDGRRCRTPRISSHPHFCFYHAQKESQSQTAEKLAKDLAYFFSGDYLSANDLNTAMGRLIPAVIRGQIKPRVARTVAYMFQTLMQSTRLAQHEYINAFGTDGWRDAIHTSVTSNHDHLYPPDPNAPENESEDEFDDNPEPDTEPELDAEPPAPPAPLQSVAPVSRACHPERSEGPCLDPASSTSDETRHPTTMRPSPAETEAVLNIARSIFPDRANATPPQSAGPQSPAPTPQACHPVYPEERRERSEGPCLDPAPSTIDETQLPSAAAPLSQPTTNPNPTQTAQPNNAPPTAPPPSQTRRQPGAPTRDPYAVHFDHNYRLFVDGKPW
jgi:hypothetical protein